MEAQTFAYGDLLIFAESQGQACLALNQQAFVGSDSLSTKPGRLAAIFTP